MPAARTASAMTGSPSSMTTQRSTDAANARIFSSGSGWTSFSSSRLAVGAASRA